MKSILFCCSLVICCLNITSVDAQSTAVYPGFEAYDSWLKAHVDEDGRVDYEKAKKSEKQLGVIVKGWEGLKPSELAWDVQKAYWINLYNAVTLQVVIAQYPVSSIRDIDGGQPWKTKRVTVEGRNLSLDEIEHEVIRPNFQDARIHFAVNCAAFSCPPLLHVAYHPERLDVQLDQQTRRFIQDRRFNRVEGDKVMLSELFSWYKEDFGEDPLQYISSYGMTGWTSDKTVEYMTYDWSLNKQR